MKRPLILVASALAAVAVLAGCSSGGGEPGGSSAPSSAPSSEPSSESAAPTSAAPADDTSAAATPSESPSFDADVDEFVDEFKQLQQTIEQYWSAKLDGYEAPARTLAFSGENDDPSTFPTCGGQAVTAENGFYCPPDNTVILDADWMYKEYTDIGDTFLYVVLAHEYGHSAQGQLASPPAEADEEIQADCFSGAFLQESIDGGTITEEDGDEQEINQTLAGAAGDFGTDDSHGTLASRASAFEYGRSNGATGCVEVDAYRR